MHTLSHPDTNEYFSFKILHPDLVQVREGGLPYEEDGCIDGMYTRNLARKLWEALTSQGFKTQ